MSTERKQIPHVSELVVAALNLRTAQREYMQLRGTDAPQEEKEKAGQRVGFYSQRLDEVLDALDSRRLDAFEAIDGERDYQDSMWNPETTPSGGNHPVGSWLTFMRDYSREAEHQISRGADPEASEAALNTIRKVTAMGVACLEQHGAPKRAPKVD